MQRYVLLRQKLTLGLVAACGATKEGLQQLYEAGMSGCMLVVKTPLVT